MVASPAIEARVEELAGLRERTTGPLGAVFEAVHATLRPGLQDREKTWIQKVEQLRSDLEASDQQIPVNLSSKEKLGNVGEITQVRSVKPLWGLLMFNLVRSLKPRNCLEMGTAVGLSGAFQAAALTLNEAGKLLTLEGSAGVAALARRNFEQLGLSNVETRAGLFKDTLKPALDDLSIVDFAFIDGHHDEEATIRYFNMILPYTPNERVLVFDDINWSEGMKNAWEVVISHERVRGIVDLRKLGICVLGDESVPRSHYRFPRLQRSESGAT